MKNLRQYDVIIIENQIFEKIKYDFRIPQKIVYKIKYIKYFLQTILWVKKKKNNEYKFFRYFIKNLYQENAMNKYLCEGKPYKTFT